MSYDQKPSRIKLVSGGRPPRLPDSADAESLNDADGEAIEDRVALPQPKGRSGLIKAMLFLAGSAAGGAGLAAWPHIAG
ncbi:hypothetical protein [Pseudoblastomonas halimionae]|uniref:Uncharacterized protein n=1 Tax=Alteriqipengyuania halimionae TaxID=1926630 RepID=A0A6I4U318_9SPHN|nr:hypothetical protein [Alteriqipengyuania halimionae]MXP10420.1 hypothetical protein [Alteriqipengyuania halimionae]